MLARLQRRKRASVYTEAEGGQRLRHLLDGQAAITVDIKPGEQFACEAVGFLVQPPVRHDWSQSELQARLR